MLIPYSVDVPRNHTPVVNWLIVAAVIGAFLLQVAAITADAEAGMSIEEQAEVGAISPFILKGWNPLGIVGHIWLHGGLFHLVGNLIFLWVFGNAVCSKLGNLWYAPLYIGLGILAGVSHLLFCGGRAIGASGAINGVVGMYLVFFPENSVSCMLWIPLPLLWRPFFFSVRGFWLVLFFFAFDILGVVLGGSGVAYWAHIGGFVAGFAIALLMLRFKLITMERDEGSILEFLHIQKRPQPPDIRRDFEPWQQQWSVENPPPPPPVAPPAAVARPPEPMVRFTCGCGQKVKMPARYAGRVGRCPRCNRRLIIPAS